MPIRLRSHNLFQLKREVARLVCAALSLLAVPAAGIAQSAAKPIPKIEKTGSTFRFVVDGSPYLMLSGQVHNSSNSNADDLGKALDVLAGWHANTAEVPIYWEAIEPQPGQFDFRSVDAAIQAARKRELRLVFLW